MSLRAVTSFVVDCDVCLRSLETGDHVALFATQAEADEQAGAAGWAQTPVGMACPREDVSHRLARGNRAT